VRAHVSPCPQRRPAQELGCRRCHQSRVWLALHCLRDRRVIHRAVGQALGFQDVLFRGREIALARPLGKLRDENILFKVSCPPSSTPKLLWKPPFGYIHFEGRLDSAERIEIETQEAGKRIIDKTGPLSNPADRDHCLQYMVAVALLKGGLTAEDYEDQTAAEPRIEELREKMRVVENHRFTHDYLDPEKRSIANAVRVFFRDGRATERVRWNTPGHRRRRAEAIPPLRAKLERAIARPVRPAPGGAASQPVRHYSGTRREAGPRVMDLWIG